MPEQTAANIFISNAVKGMPMTPYKHTRHRPMLYVDIGDVCRAFEAYAMIALRQTKDIPATNTVNLMHPSPITILQLARIVRRKFANLAKTRHGPRIEIVDKGIAELYSPRESKLFRVDVSKARKLLGGTALICPENSIERILTRRIEELRKSGHQTVSLGV